MPDLTLLTFQAEMTIENMSTLLRSLSGRGILSRLSESGKFKIHSRLVEILPDEIKWSFFAVLHELEKRKQELEALKVRAGLVADYEPDEALEQEYFQEDSAFWAEWLKAKRSIRVKAYAYSEKRLSISIFTSTEETDFYTPGHPLYGLAQIIFEECRGEIVQSQLSGQELAATELVPKPWEQIPDRSWHREAVKLWWNGHTCEEIAVRLDKDLEAKTVRNALTELRKTYGEDVVPLAKNRD